MICVTLLLLIPAMYWGVVCALYGYCMVVVLINQYTLVKSEYVSFPIGMSALCNRSNSAGVVGLCRSGLYWGVPLPWVCVNFSIAHTILV